MNLFEVLVFGLIQGPTEYLPVSSYGHQAIAVIPAISRSGATINTGLLAILFV